MTIDFMFFEKYADDDLVDALEHYPISFFEALRTILKEEGIIRDIQEPFISVYNMPVTIPIAGIQEELFGQLIQFEGEIVSHTQTETAILTGAFQCVRCKKVISHQSSDGSIEYPLECYKDQGGCGRDRGHTKFKFLSEFSSTKSYQWIRVEERLYDQANRPHIDVYLDSPLVDAPNPEERIYKDGNVVKVVGIVKVHEKKRKEKLNVELYIDGSSVEVIAQAVTDVEPTEEQIKEIKKLAKGQNIMGKLINSICPEIEGYEPLKKLLLLTMFYGKVITLVDGTRVRHSPNVIIFGDLSSGKSIILRWMANFYPKSGYSSGRGSSPAGLFGMPIRDDMHGSKFTFVSGLIPRCDGGICTIDEFEKHIKDYGVSQFLEVMEQRTATFSKGDIRGLTLEADCPLICACNWENGFYDPYRAANEQIPKEISPLLLSRSILVNVDTMRKNIDQDKKLKRIAAKYDNTKNELTPEIPPNIFRAYISYARKYINPSIINGGEVFMKIKENFKDLSKYHTEPEESSIPITDRLFEDIIRLTEASARIHLREEPTAEDVKNALECITLFLRQFAIDSATGEFDIRIIASGKSLSQMKLMQCMYEAIKETDGGVSIDDLVEQFPNEDVGRIKTALEIMKEEGRVYEKDERFRTSR